MVVSLRASTQRMRFHRALSTSSSSSQTPQGEKENRKDERRIASTSNNELKDIVTSGVLAFGGFGLLSSLHLYGTEGVHLLQASLGATAVLIFGAPQAPASQPRAIILGHGMAGLIGVSIAGLVGADVMPLAAAAPLAVSTTLMSMRALARGRNASAIGSGRNLPRIVYRTRDAGSVVLVGTAWLAGLRPQMKRANTPRSGFKRIE